MITRDLLLEIGLEEMPSAFMNKALEDFKSIAAQKFADKRIGYQSIGVMGTPRRLVLHIKGLQEKQADALIENRGPKKESAYTADGSPSKAALGFARGQGVSVTDLEVRDVAGVEYVFAVKKESGIDTMALLPEILLDVINSLGFPKSMRWGYYHTRFARPIRWLLAIYGDEFLSIQVENVVSSEYTRGHRFLAPEPIKVKNIPEFFNLLNSNYVILDQDERSEIIWQQVQEVARQSGGNAMENDDLLNEVTFLLEYPTAFYGEFSTSYLEVPPEVLTTSMIENQRYFPIFDDSGKLLPGFIGVRNGTDYCLDVVKAGNERVLKARLEDALFFWKEDNKKPLSALVPRLKDVLYHERLGSTLNKVERLQKLAIYIGKENNLSDAEKLQRAAYLCKADLLSNMVYEFPELQGIMGRYYAINSGESNEVAQAIFEHYLPRFASDVLPTTETGIALALAEKMHNLVGCFAIGIKPSGSQDPYALRRQALGIVNIIIDLGLTIDLKKLIEEAYQGFVDLQPELNQVDTVNEVMDFIMQRMRGVALDKGLTYDVIDAVLSLRTLDLNDILLRTKVIQRFKDSPHFEDFMVVFNRSHNLTKKWQNTAIDESILIDASEKALFQKLNMISNEANRAIAEADYETGMIVLTGLRNELDKFFEAVMVMVDDEKLRAARLGLLKAIANQCNSIADFSKILF